MSLKWGARCGWGSSVVAAAINQEVAIASVVLYRALRPDSGLASLSALAPRTWLSTLPDPAERNAPANGDRNGGELQFKGSRREGRIIPITVDIKMSTLCHLIQIPHTSHHCKNLRSLEGEYTG